MRQFMDVLGRYFADHKSLIMDQVFESIVAQDFVDGQRLCAFDTGEVVEVPPDVIAFTLAEVDAMVGGLENQIIEISRLDFELFLFLPFRLEKANKNRGSSHNPLSDFIILLSFDSYH